VPVSALVNNAGFGHYGAFAETDLKLQSDMMQVNMHALVELTHLFLQPMLARRAGRILNVASVAAFQPGPTVNIYYASKAFVYSFSYALAAELEGTGVTVTALCPGTTRTEFFERAHIKLSRPWPLMDAGKVAQLGFQGMMKGKRVVIPGFTNRLMAAISPCLPSRLTSGIVRRVHQPEVT
jgi:short-subunit dehydrogenase